MEPDTSPTDNTPTDNTPTDNTPCATTPSDTTPPGETPSATPTPEGPNPMEKHPVTFIKCDQDYVATFRQVTRVNLMIKRRGATPKRLLWRSSLHYAMGDFERSAQDAAQILHADPENAEGYFRIATASLALAVQQLNRHSNAATRPRAHHRNTPREHLIVAQMALRKVCKINSGDEEAREALESSQWLLGALPELEPEEPHHNYTGYSPT